MNSYGTRKGQGLHSEYKCRYYLSTFLRAKEPKQLIAQVLGVERSEKVLVDLINSSVGTYIGMGEILGAFPALYHDFRRNLTAGATVACLKSPVVT